MKYVKALIIALTFTMIFPILSVQYIDVLSDFNIFEESMTLDWSKFPEDGYEIRTFNNAGIYFEHHYDPNTVKSIIIMSQFVKEHYLQAIPRKKLILFLWEPLAVDLNYCKWFKSVFTIRDQHVDGKHFIKLFYPCLKPMIQNTVPFSERKLSCLITQNWSLVRQRVVNFFNGKPQGLFDFYGKRPGPFEGNKMYKGTIPGSPNGSEKIDCLKNYKFAFCYENTNWDGYVSEKIFSCFAAGAVPIYSGAPNIEKYIPSSCYIDMRKFKHNYSRVLDFITTMSEEEHANYLANIRRYLNSRKAFIFSPEYLKKNLLREIRKDT